ncbi:serine/threonine protein kinase, FIKK family [Plasmodium berghei]|uniref:non-specific serine/threonine protein kinase n=2 Tax=Plasmodium berghei TaxID=5821 RepID=A0A509AMC9_PLABA|nr:serine/threonine protein kinase, FIKK family [Plasmodium berghei ANKA]SCM25195.1 serine/threonine protein kinase, FIKK family [Plasmodium berghei]SCN27292.1 serine/threonine protein kinase, FIKK family [Plasmodium berghei]SCO63718.1 serine/threonine protein kinase, FIKK family [Plasmodium berghei]VUC57149.1 serine/threonine protein kinase, FIKK family [Plasmodium berghei ANKA]|eukprot:XP_034422928.1 serine/threonine protein kinase, FIKK family [Plasmodium berghei ANKA]
MIDSADKIEYSKEKTLACNGGNKDYEQDESSLKYKKTLDMDTIENDFYNCMEKESICDEKNKLEQFSVNKTCNVLKKSVYTESGSKDSYYFQNIKDISKKNEDKNYKEVDDNDLSTNVNNLYNKNIIGTKYYDQSIKDSISDKSSKETVCPLESDINNNNNNSTNVINYQNCDQKNASSISNSCINKYKQLNSDNNNNIGNCNGNNKSVYNENINLEKSEIKNIEKNKSFDYCNDLHKNDQTSKELKYYETNHEKLVYLEKNNLIDNNCNDIEYINDTTVDYISLKNLSQYSLNESLFKENNSNDISNCNQFDHIINVNNSNSISNNDFFDNSHVKDSSSTKYSSLKNNSQFYNKLTNNEDSAPFHEKKMKEKIDSNHASGNRNTYEIYKNEIGVSKNSNDVALNKCINVQGKFDDNCGERNKYIANDNKLNQDKINNDYKKYIDNNKSNICDGSKNMGHHGESDKWYSNKMNENNYIIEENDYQNNKNLHTNKEMNISKKKNDTTLKKSGIYEYRKYEKNKCLEGYYHNEHSEINLRNVKCKNSSSGYNEIINNNNRNNNINSQYMIPSSQIGCNKNNKKKENMVYYEPRRNIDKMGGRAEDMNSRMVTKINENIDSKEANENAVSYKDAHRSNINSIINCNNMNQNYHNKCNNNYYNPITENDIIHNEIDYNNIQGKKYYLASPKKNDGTKYSKNQMLMISKQKIKKMWNKFKNGSKDQNISSTIEDENNMFPNAVEDCNMQQKVQIYNDHYETNNDNHSNGYKDCVNKPIKWVKNNNIEKPIQSKCIFNWKIAQMSLLKLLHSAHNFHFNNVKYHDWKFICIPTLGFSKSSNRVQQMYKAIIPSKDGNSKNDVKLFIKKIPIYIWVKQFNLMTEFDGEYVTDGENFVMEAASLAFLSEYHPRIAPKLHKILYEVDNTNLDGSNNNIPPESMFSNLTVFNNVLEERLKNNINGNIVLVSEFFSEDILDFIDRRQKNFNMKISNNEKSYILYQCLKLLIRLHDAGLSHLDLTPENILISDNYEMRLCDLSKSTPIYTYNLRHIKDVNRLYLFESCEPTIAKGAYMPPECWKIYWKYDTMKIKNPLRDLKSITDQEKRKQFYFDVANADKFMLGVFFFWIWTNGNLWKCSDPLQDEDFFYFVKCDMNFDKFELTRKWPSELKSIIKGLLHAETRKKLNLKDMIMHPWWSCKL